MRISDWSSDVCSSDLRVEAGRAHDLHGFALTPLDGEALAPGLLRIFQQRQEGAAIDVAGRRDVRHGCDGRGEIVIEHERCQPGALRNAGAADREGDPDVFLVGRCLRSEEHTSELQSLMRISYAVFCLKKKTTRKI